jgi:uncharacterized membrane protein
MQPFLAGSLGTVLGGVIGLRHIARSGVPQNGAASVTACLIASYIGGSANFFEVAALTSTDDSAARQLVNTAAGLDIGVMVLYFTLITLLSTTFGESKVNATSSNKCVQEEDEDSEYRSAPLLSLRNRLDSASCNTLSAASAVGIVSCSLELQRFLIPGASVILSTLFSTLLVGSVPSNRLPAFRRAAILPSRLFMTIFYVTVGLNVNLGSEFMDDYLTILRLIITILATHLLFAVGGGKVYSMVTGNAERRALDWDAIAVASNAAVGGSSTAASMAAALGKNKLVLPGALAGLFGYVIGSQVALIFFRRLLNII